MRDSKKLKEKEEDVMKTRILLMSGLFALTFIVAGQVAQAQEAMSATIPFDFAAGQTTLPAGTYRIEPLNSGSAFLVLKDQDDPSTTIMVLANRASRRKGSDTKLVFHRYGDRYFLSQLWTEGNSYGRELRKSAAEKEIGKVAKAETKGEVTLMARVISTHR
jgi:hypothetical protein